MEKVKITRDQVSAIYDELDRRTADLLRDQLTIDEIELTREEMMQGIYCALITISADWPAVCEMCRREEDERYYYDRG